MKIVHISLYAPKGEKHTSISGVASYTKNLLTSMPKSKDERVYVLCNKIDGKYEKYTEDGLTIIRCFERSPAFLWQIKGQLKQINPDVVHIQQELALYGSIFTAYLLQWLVLWCRAYSPVITLHGVVNPRLVDKAFVKENNSSLPPWLVRLAFLVIYKPLTVWAKKVIVHEDYFKKTLEEKYNVPPAKIRVIPHGVETFQPQQKSEACKKLGLVPQRNLMLFMGYLTGYKGVELLIEGFAVYAKRNPNAFLVIGAGEHPKLQDSPKYQAEYRRLQQKAADLIPKAQYTWPGFIPEDEVKSYYSACDVSVYPYTTAMSSSGPMSFAIGLERPFLASTAFSEVLDEQLLFERTATTLTEKLEDFFTHTKKYEGISRRMKTERTWPNVARLTHNVYEEVAS